MSTKYIVNNVSGQTINGDLTINGDVVITGTTNTRPYKVFTALLTQSGGDGPSEEYQGDEIYSGITYYIFTNDDNFDLVQYGAPNSNVGTYFVCNQNATLPLDINIQLNYNTGAPVVTVLENTIGNIWFDYIDVGYYRVDSDNLFITNKTTLSISNSREVNSDLPTTNILIGFGETSLDFICLLSDGSSTNDTLTYTLMEIRVYN
jgi:hypothetical protein